MDAEWCGMLCMGRGVRSSGGFGEDAEGWEVIVETRRGGVVVVVGTYTYG